MDLPTLFISHGAPTFAIEPGRLGPQLRSLGQTLQGVAAVLVVSAHWQSRGVEVMFTENPETIHDFGGFPEELYSLHYLASGSPVYAQRAYDLLQAAGISVQKNVQRGYDHGAWVPLMHMFPDAAVPVFQISLPVNTSPASVFAMGQALAALRSENVLIMGSGSMTHNLREARWGAIAPDEYVAEFTNWVYEAIRSRDMDVLLNYRSLAPHAVRAHPTEEHFLPLFIALGASGDKDKLDLLEGGVDLGCLSMDSYVWG